MGPDVEQKKDSTDPAGKKYIGGLAGVDQWLKHWMPMIFASPAYQNGKLLVVLTFDESGFSDSRACEKTNQADCASPTGPNVDNPGFSPILGQFHLQTPPTQLFQYAGGGQGHLGFAAIPGLKPFGSDVFNAVSSHHHDD